MDFCKRVPYSPLPSGFYYWTSVYYLDRDAFSSDAHCIAEVQAIERVLCLESVLFVRSQLKSPIGRDNVRTTINYTFGQGGQIPDNGEYSMFNIARWRLWSDADRYSYRLNRTPLIPEWIDGVNLSPLGLFRQQSGLNAFLFPGLFYNSYGELLTRGEVKPSLSMWQMRDGTKRRERNPLAP